MVSPPGRWECPWHQCDICGKEAASFCEMCPSSYCREHRDGMLFISKLDGKLSCSEHDPCGPEPLEPGEIREYVPNMTSMRPGAPAAPVPMVPDSGGTAPVAPTAGQAASQSQRPPPRLYINTKTATSSFIPFNNPYLTDRTEASASSKEEGEVEDGEVCGLDVEEVEDDEDEEEEEDEEEDDDDVEEMEIVEDEEEDAAERDSEGGNISDAWSLYGDEDGEEGEVEGEEWPRFEGEDK